VARGKILLTDDDVPARTGMAALLRRADFEVTEAGSAAEALRNLAQGRFDVLLTDVVMPDDQSLGYLEQAVSTDPAMAVLVMTGHASLDTAVRALRGGAIDYLQKPFGAEALMSAIERGLEATRASRAAGELKMLAGDLQERMQTLEEALQSPGRVRPGVIPPAQPLNPEILDKLSPREREIVLQLHTNKSVNEVAQSLFISVHTVRNHVKSAFKKLGVHSQTELLDLLRSDTLTVR
jgi:DNA-binding NarL/FixJ family response regulator